jgi:hypothetical protein
MTYLYNATDDDTPADDLPCVPSMDMLQDYYNAGHEYEEEDEEDDDRG